MKEKRKPAITTDLDVPALDLTQLEQILSFMSQHGLEEFEYCRADLRIKLRKSPSNSGFHYSRPNPPETNADAPATVVEVGEGTASLERPKATDSTRTEDLHMVKSPIVGTYYESSSPGAEPFVKVGDQVEIGQVMCIIEAMKLMNEIESDIAGEVVRVLVQSGQPVEYGEPLFALRSTEKK